MIKLSGSDRRGFRSFYLSKQAQLLTFVLQAVKWFYPDQRENLRAAVQLSIYIYILGKSIMLFAFCKSNSGLLDRDLVKHYNYTVHNTTLLMAVKTKAKWSVVKWHCDTGGTCATQEDERSIKIMHMVGGNLN